MVRAARWFDSQRKHIFSFWILRLLPVAHSSAKTIQMSSSMIFIQSNGCKEIDLIFKKNTGSLYDMPALKFYWYRAWPSPIMSGFHGAFATGVACQQGTLTLPDTWFRPPFWDLLMLQLLKPNSSNLPCPYSTFHLEYPLVLSRFCIEIQYEPGARLV